MPVHIHLTSSQYLMISGTLFVLGMMFSVALIHAFRPREPKDVTIARLRSTSSRDRSVIRQLRAEREQAYQELEQAHEHSHRLVTEPDYYRKMTRGLLPAIERSMVENTRFDVKV